MRSRRSTLVYDRKRLATDTYSREGQTLHKAGACMLSFSCTDWALSSTTMNLLTLMPPRQPLRRARGTSVTGSDRAQRETGCSLVQPVLERHSVVFDALVCRLQSAIAVTIRRLARGRT